MSLWVLCVLLDRFADARAECTREPSEVACHAALIDWVERAAAWEVRSGLSPRSVAGCSERAGESAP